jgi:D-beta-D-heptose 7-phosphate kinase/D-beta-D-heptose 1-phosphate adenosyltransferase
MRLADFVELAPTVTKFAGTVKTLICLETRQLPIETDSFSCYPLTVSDKVKSLAELSAITASAKANGRILVFTNGCFDLLHRGHVHLLRNAKALGDVLVVAINSDQSVKLIKGPKRPILSENDRLQLIASMEMVNYVLLFDEPNPCNIISILRPNILVKGGDWPADQVVGADIVQASGGKVVVVPYLKGSSTTEIIAKIRS